MYTQSPVQMAGGSIQFECNAYWVTICVKGHITYQRRADKGPWLDASHNKITAALEALENAVKEAALEP